jgi:competence protein ComEA
MLAVRFYFSRMEQTVLAVLLLAILGALFALSYAYGRRQRDYADAPFLELASVEEAAAVPSTDEPASEIVVHVTGAVKQPGVYRFFPGARIDDALRQAGGAREDGYPEGLNLAAKLEDGERICVPTKAEWERLIAGGGDPLRAAPVSGAVTTSRPPPKTGGSSERADAGPKPLPERKINLNTATLDDLITLPNIGPVTAQRILDYRGKEGKFTDLAQLLNVTGIGPKTFEKIVPFVEL